MINPLTSVLSAKVPVQMETLLKWHSVMIQTCALAYVACAWTHVR